MLQTQPSAHDIRRIAVEAKVDPRTVRRRIAGKTVQSTTAARIDDALRALGFVKKEARGGRA